MEDVIKCDDVKLYFRCLGKFGNNLNTFNKQLFKFKPQNETNYEILLQQSLISKIYYEWYVISTDMSNSIKSPTSETDHLQQISTLSILWSFIIRKKVSSINGNSFDSPPKGTTITYAILLFYCYYFKQHQPLFGVWKNIILI